MSPRSIRDAALFALVLCATPRAVRAQGAPVDAPPAAAAGEVRMPWRIAVGFGPAWRVTPGYALWSNDRTSGFAEVSLARQLASFTGRGAVDLEAGYRTEPLSGSIANAARTWLDAHSAFAAVWLRWRVRPWFEPFVRASAALTVSSARWTLGTGETLGATNVGFTGGIGGGILFQSGPLGSEGPRRASVLGGLEVGGWLGTPYTPVLVNAPAEGGIPVQGTSPGRVDPWGPFLRLLFGVRF